LDPFLYLFDDYIWYLRTVNKLLKTKGEALDFFKKIKSRAEAESDGKLKALRTDRGGEFTSHLFSVFCSEGGVKHYTTTPYTPQQNGVVERRNQTVVEMARCLLKTMHMPSVFWGEAVATAVYLLNRSPTKALNNRTPFEAWHGKKPRVDHQKIFGCVGFVKHVGLGLKKLSDRSSKMVFIGYESGTKGYRFYDPSAGRLLISRDVVFYEGQPWNWEESTSERMQQSKNSFVVHYETDENPTTDPIGDQDAAEVGGITCCTGGCCGSK